MKPISAACYIFIMIFISGCLGAAPRLIRYDIYGSDLKIGTNHFLESFSGFLKDKGYKAKIINQDDRKNEKYSVRDETGNYPILLEAYKGFTIVRVCEKNTGSLFIQVVQVASILIWDPDKHLEKESKIIKEIISSKYPYLRIE